MISQNSELLLETPKSPPISTGVYFKRNKPRPIKELMEEYDERNRA